MLKIREIPKKLSEKARLELNEDTNRMVELVKNLRDWINFQPHLKIRTDDQFLINVLRSCKYRVEKAKHRIDGVCSARNKLDEFFVNRDIQSEHTKDIVRQGYAIYIPKLEAEDSARILIARPGCYDPKKYCFKDFIPFFTMLVTYLAENDDNIIIGGIIAILDGSNITATHLTHYDLMFLKNMASLYGNAASVRIKSVHVINAPPFALAFFDIVKMIAPEKIRNKITIHGSNLEALYKEIPKYLLPEEYGGEMGSIENLAEDLLQKLCADWDTISQWKYYGVDESKRPEDNKVNDIYGIEGTFKSLSFD